MKAPNRLHTLSINLSLVILALGFSAIGFFSVINKLPSLSTGILSVEHAYSLIGSIFSVLVGAIFLAAAIAFRGMRSGYEGLAARIDSHLI
jgi:membrane associated rhomboid family serine protease